MDEIEMRLKKKHQLNNYQTKKSAKERNHLNFLFTRILIATIFVLGSAIYINWSKSNLENYKKAVFDTNISFTTINSWYKKYFGSSLPINLETNTVPVNKNIEDFQNIEKFHDGVRIQVPNDSAINTLNSGIIVFMGEKENYKNVVIIQGIDGVDIWYGNLENVGFSLYDYVEKGKILGSAKEDHIYLVLQKEGQYLDYEEYISQI